MSDSPQDTSEAAYELDQYGPASSAALDAAGRDRLARRQGHRAAAGRVCCSSCSSTAYGQIKLNEWNKPFYDAISRRDLNDFMYQLGVFFIIAGALLVLNVMQRWLVETTKYKLRAGLAHDLLFHWLQPRRAFWLANAGAIGVNPDQRMHEDARKLCELSGDLGVGLLQATILFLTFAGVLWNLVG